MNVHAPSPHDYRAFLRIASSSIAHPPWFAVPVDAHEDAESLTVIFHAPEKVGQLHVYADEKSVIVCGAPTADGHRPKRVCALPCDVDPHRIETSRSEALLRVRIAKKTGARALPHAPASAA